MECNRLHCCRECHEPFDTDYLVQEKKEWHRLPVSCQRCPYMICYWCYKTNVVPLWQMQVDDGQRRRWSTEVQCPSCQAMGGFDAAKPNIAYAACPFIERIKLEEKRAQRQQQQQEEQQQEQQRQATEEEEPQQEHDSAEMEEMPASFVAARLHQEENRPAQVPSADITPVTPATRTALEAKDHATGATETEQRKLPASIATPPRQSIPAAETNEAQEIVAPRNSEGPSPQHNTTIPAVVTPQRKVLPPDDTDKSIPPVQVATRASNSSYATEKRASNGGGPIKAFGPPRRKRLMWGSCAQSTVRQPAETHTQANQRKRKLPTHQPKDKSPLKMARKIAANKKPPPRGETQNANTTTTSEKGNDNIVVDLSMTDSENEIYKRAAVLRPNYVASARGPTANRDDRVVDIRQWKQISCNNLFTMWEGTELAVLVYQHGDKIILRYPTDGTDEDGCPDEFEGHRTEDKLQLTMHGGATGPFDGSNGTLVDTDGKVIEIYKGSRTAAPHQQAAAARAEPSNQTDVGEKEGTNSEEAKDGSNSGKDDNEQERNEKVLKVAHAPVENGKLDERGAALPPAKQQTEAAPAEMKKKKSKRRPPAGQPKEEREWLQNRPLWFEEFEEFLDDFEYPNGKQLDPKNISVILRQSKLLRDGQGVDYVDRRTKERKWAVDFYTGRKVHISDDFRQIMLDAYEHEEKYGEDASHGWRITHAVGWMSKFQAHLLKEERESRGQSNK